MSFVNSFSRRATTKSLVDMLQVRRPARSKTEESFVSHYIDRLPNVTADAYGNRIVRVGNTKTRPPVLWSCHTDTVHTKDGMQSVTRDGALVRLHKKETDSSCLGGDDSAGVWIMRQMILRQIPGLYVFHRDEEVGGLGSDWIAKNNPKLFDGVSYAIAIDRKGYNSVITHQGSRCASDDFARSLAAQLGGSFAPDSTGVFTDTAQYTAIIPECSNISCGYEGAHSVNETQDIYFAHELLERLCALDHTKITVKRDPKEIDYYDSYDWHDSWFDSPFGAYSKNKGKSKNAYLPQDENVAALVDLLRYEDAYTIADFLDAMGIDAREVADHLGYIK